MPKDDRIRARYWIETAQNPEKAAAAMAGEQSSGTFVKVPGQTAELEERSAARVESVEVLDRAAAPSLPGAARPAGSGGYQRAEVELSWPIANMGPSLPNLQATVAGNLFELKPFSGLRLLDIDFPEAFRDAYPGPAFGVEGTRRLAGVERLPLIGTIIKPSVGLDPQATAAMVERLIAGGIDFIKDDELQADGPHCPFAERVAAVMGVINRHAERTGKKPMFAFNLTGEIDEMRRRHDAVLAAGGTCVMASIHSIGLPGLTSLRRHAQLPIHAHRNGWGLYSRSPAVGVSYIAWQKLWRLAGADHLHVNGLRNKFAEPDESVIASAKQCLTPMFPGDGRGCEAMPVFSSGQWAGLAFETFERFGSTHLIHTAGGGIVAHPSGIEAGVEAFRQAWDGAVQGRTLEETADEHPELREAVETFGS